jgi:hypothetical protein
MPTRDDFTERVKRSLAARAGHHCSNPDCRATTSGPQVDETKALNVGVAAHITAAAEGGPRFDAGLSPRERVADSNGIWLCQNCAKLVDNDEARYPRELLIDWKRGTEDEALAQVGKTQRNRELLEADDTFSLARESAVRGVIVELLKNARLAMTGSATVSSGANQIPYTSATYFDESSWMKNSQRLGQILDLEVLDKVTSAYDSARRVFDFVGKPYPATKVKFQLHTLLASLARELVEAAALLADQITDQGERQRTAETIEKLRARVRSQSEVAELLER